jgi:hypothetical protein
MLYLLLHGIWIDLTSRLTVYSIFSIIFSRARIEVSTRIELDFHTTRYIAFYSHSIPTYTSFRIRISGGPSTPCMSLNLSKIRKTHSFPLHDFDIKKGGGVLKIRFVKGERKKKAKTKRG